MSRMIGGSRAWVARWSWLAALAVLAAGLGWFGQTAPAQGPPAAPATTAPPSTTPPPKPPTTLPVDPQQDSAAARKAVMGILKGGTVDDAQKKQLAAYYDGFAFARWTRSTDYASIPEFRRQLASELRAASTGPVYDHLVGLTMIRMKEFIKPEYHPVVRYNAMLVIGELNTAEMRSSARQAVVPLPEAQRVLLAELNNPSQADLVKVAVLIGLIRHCGLGFSDPKVRDEQVVKPLQALALPQSPVPQGRSKEGDAWMRVLAIDALAALRYPGSNGAVAVTFASLVKTDDPETVPPTVRMAAARGLGSLEYKVDDKPVPVKPMELAAALAKMAHDACVTERNRPAPTARGGAPGGGPGSDGRPGGYRPPRGYPGPKGPMGPSMGPSMGPAGEGYDDPEHIAQFRRRLKTLLSAARAGFGSPSRGRETAIFALAADTPDKDYVKNAYEAIDQLVVKVLDDKEITLSDLNKKVDEGIAKLKGLVEEARAGGPAPGPAAPPPPAGGPPPVKTTPVAPGKAAPIDPAKQPAPPTP